MVRRLNKKMAKKKRAQSGEYRGLREKKGVEFSTPVKRGSINQSGGQRTVFTQFAKRRTSRKERGGANREGSISAKRAN